MLRGKERYSIYQEWMMMFRFLLKFLKYLELKQEL